jgi:signal transduction histidine kinase
MSPRQLAIQHLVEAGWLFLADRLIHGICHDLNGRSGSISSLAYLLNAGEEPASVTAIMEEESHRLEENVRFLRLLLDDDEGPQMLAPGEVLPSLAKMIPLQRGLEGVQVRVSIPPTAPAVRIDKTIFIRVFLLLVSAAAEEAGRSGTSTVDVTATKEGSVLSIHPARVERPDGPSSTPRSVDTGIPSQMEVWIHEILAEVGGGLSRRRRTQESPGWEIRLPPAP